MKIIYTLDELTPAQLKGERVETDLDLSSLTTLPEGVSLTAGDYLDLSSLTTLPEGVSLTTGGSLYLSSLTTLPEGVSLTAGGSLYLSRLTSIKQWSICTLYLASSARAAAAIESCVALKIFLRSISSASGDSLDLSSLTTLSEGVSLTAGGSLYLNCLTTLPEGVSLTAGGHLDLRSLTTLSEGVSLTAGGSLDLRSLTTLPEGVSLTAGGSLNLSSQTLPATITRPWFESPCKKYLIADGKASEIVSKQRNLYTVRHFGSNQDSFVAVSSKFCAHGSTEKEAKDDLRFKQAQHRMQNEPIGNDTPITVDRYRAITGACREGVRNWMSSNGITEGIPAGKLLPILRKTNAYGLSSFEKLLA